MLTSREKYIDQFRKYIPSLEDSLTFSRSLTKPSMPKILSLATQERRLLFQARNGAGPSVTMKKILRRISSAADIGISTITIDSLTRNLSLKELNKIFKGGYLACLNGYPLISHGVSQTRELHHFTSHPIQIRHGSPDARLLAEMSYASGVSGFEGGGISYNLPYVKDVPLKKSLSCWQYVDALTGLYEDQGVEIDRETFGTLTAVLMPPCISVAISLIESLLMIKEGVKNISLSFPQTGSLIQDMATAKSLRYFIKELFGGSDTKFTLCYHAWMGVFPQDLESAWALIEYSVKSAYYCDVERMIIKTPVEAQRIPNVQENFETLLYCHTIKRPSYDERMHKEVSFEQNILVSEVKALIEPIWSGNDLFKAIIKSFSNGFLDVPFSPSVHTRSLVIPMRDQNSRIRFFDCGKLPFPKIIKEYHRDVTYPRLDYSKNVSDLVKEDIFYFRDKSSRQIQNLFYHL